MRSSKPDRLGLVSHSEEIRLRQALPQDGPAIRKLIHEVGINPMGLHWSRFVLAVDDEGKMIGCAQIKSHSDGTHELASLAVIPEWRGKGVARRLIEYLVQAHFQTSPHEPLYLTCRGSLGPLYEHFGFRRLNPPEMPTYFRRIHRLVQIFHKMKAAPSEGLWVMRLES